MRLARGARHRRSRSRRRLHLGSVPVRQELHRAGQRRRPRADRARHGRQRRLCRRGRRRHRGVFQPGGHGTAACKEAPQPQARRADRASRLFRCIRRNSADHRPRRGRYRRAVCRRRVKDGRPVHVQEAWRKGLEALASFQDRQIGRCTAARRPQWLRLAAARHLEDRRPQAKRAGWRAQADRVFAAADPGRVQPARACRGLAGGSDGHALQSRASERRAPCTSGRPGR